MERFTPVTHNCDRGIFLRKGGCYVSFRRRNVTLFPNDAFYAVYLLFFFLSHSIRRCSHTIYISPVSCANAPLSVLEPSPEVERRCRVVRGAVLLRERTRDGRRARRGKLFFAKKGVCGAGRCFDFVLSERRGGRTKSRFAEASEKILGEPGRIE